MPHTPIYLDYNASTPVDPRVRRAAEPLLEGAFGNPSSTHWAAVPARTALERARAQVAALLGAEPREVVFTSGGSESNNAALKGVWFGPRGDRDHLVSTAVEHPAVLEPLRWLRARGARVTLLPVDGAGRVDPDELRRALTPRTCLVSVMHANNEVGTVQPVAEIGRICREAGIPLHCDAAQSVGKIPVRVDELGVDLLSVAGHKVYAPKGVGVLYVRTGTALEPLIHGAGHEGGRRAGTESALLATSLGTACALAGDGSSAEEARLRDLRDRFWEGLLDLCGDRVVRNGHPGACLPNTLHVSFLGRTGAEVLGALPGVAASTGSACHEGRLRVSHVLAAMGASADVARGAVRWSLGRPTTRDEVDQVLLRLEDTLRGRDGAPRSA